MKTNISLILLGLGLVSGSVYAAHADETPMPVSNDINVTAPDQTGMWSFGVTALLMQPIGGTFDYADSLSSVTPNGSMTDREASSAGGVGQNTVDQTYNWWFGADVTYTFPGNGRDVMLAYEGMHSSNTNSTGFDSTNTATSANYLSSPFNYADNPLNLSYSADGGTFTHASGKSEINYDAGDLVFGQKIDEGTRVRLHPFAGLRYAYINQKDTGYYTGGLHPIIFFPVLVNEDVTETGQLNSTFSGIGPRFGSDAQVNLSQGFSVRGRLGLSALIGSRKADNSFVDSYYDTAGALVRTDAESANTNSQTRVVPEIDGRLGLNYTYTFDSNMALGVEAGWQAENYFDSIIDVNGNSANFALQGPYGRLQLDVS